MPIYNARVTIGMALLIVHAVSIFAIAYYGNKLMTFEDTTSSILILTPMTVNYISIFLKDLTSDQFDILNSQNVRIKLSAFIVQATVILIFAFALISSVLAFAVGGNISVNQFKIYLGIVESAFGVFVGIVMSGTFNVK